MSEENDSSDHQNGYSYAEGEQSSPRPGNISDELLNMVGASPPRFVTFEQLMSAADGMKNMTLAHEIAVNNDFQLPSKESAPDNSIEKQISETMRKAFWATFQEKIDQDPPDYTMALSVLTDLKEMLLQILLPQQQKLKEQINELLDEDLLKQELENGVLDFNYYGSCVTDLMAKLCAPARDEKIAEIRTISEVVPKFKAIMETIELMQRDMANFTIKQVRPYIQQHSIEYEKKKFAAYLEVQRSVGIDALQYTAVWLKRNYEKIVQATESQTVSGASANPVPTPANVMTEAYLEIFEWPDPNNFPETLLMDQFRFMGLRDRLHTLGLITAVQLITYSVIGPAVEGVEDLKKQLKDHVEVLLQDVSERGIKSVLESIGEQVVKDVTDSLGSRKLPAVSDKGKEALKGQIKDLANKANTVRKLMNARLMNFVKEGMSGKNMTSLRVPKGCSVVQHELAQVFGNFLRLTSHNRSVFGEYYAAIIERCIKGDENVVNGQTVVNGQAEA